MPKFQVNISTVGSDLNPKKNRAVYLANNCQPIAIHYKYFLRLQQPNRKLPWIVELKKKTAHSNVT